MLKAMSEKEQAYNEVDQGREEMRGKDKENIQLRALNEDLNDQMHIMKEDVLRL